MAYILMRYLIQLRMKGFFLTCPQALELAEKSNADQISWWNKLKLKWHMKFCHPCRTYWRHSHLIDCFLTRFFQKQEADKKKYDQEAAPMVTSQS